MTIAPEPEVTTTVYDEVDWRYGDSTRLYDPRFLFPPEELVALARAHAGCPGLVHRELRGHMDAEAVSRLFGLEGAVGVGGGGSGSTAGFPAAEAGTTTDGDDAGFYQETGYVMVEDPGEWLEYVLVVTADEVGREQKVEADAEAGWNDCVRSIEELLEDAGVEEEPVAHDAGGKINHDRSVVEQLWDDFDEAGGEEEDDVLTARRKLIRDIDRSLEEEVGWNYCVRSIKELLEDAGVVEAAAAHDAGWTIVDLTFEQYFACVDNEEASVPE